MTTLDEFVEKGFEEHATDAAGVFARLPEGVALVTEAKHLPQLANLVTHVGGEHLGRWKDALELLERLEGLPVYDAASPQGKAVLRSKAVLARCAGDREASERFAAEARTGGKIPEASDRIRILTTSAQALIGQERLDEGRADFDEAVALAAYGPVASDPATRALAAAGNNISVALENRATLDDAERALMLRAAAVGLTYWRIAGGWMQEERALYRLALAHVKAGDGKTALDHAQECLLVVEEHGSDPGETFFAHEAILRAQIALRDGVAANAERTKMAAILPTIVDAGFRGFCEKELAKLDASLAQP